jgi:hypothetical protein
MHNRTWATVGLIIAVAGAVFTLQGIGVIGGSFMSGSALWAVLGPVIAALGVWLYARATRRRQP